MSQPPSSRRRWFLYAAVAVVFAGAVWFFAVQSAPPKPSGFGSFRSRDRNQAVPIRAEAARKADLAVYLRAIGTVVPLNTVVVRSRVDGQLIKVHFSEGQEVKAGQLLAEIDDEPYRLRLAQMEGAYLQSQSQVRTAKADLERFKQLNAQTLVTLQQLEAQQALVAEREGLLAVEKARVDDARRQLDYTRIEAPIAGRLGLRQVDAGNMVRAGDSGGLVTITQTRPITVNFTVPEVELQKVIAPLRAGEALHVEAWDRSERTQLATGSLRTVDNQIDLATGTLRLKAEFPNTDEKLFPNQFVNVRLRVQTLRDAVVIPSVGVQFGSRGNYVYIVGPENKAAVRDVVLGPSEGQVQAITQGLAPGDLVVLEGLDRLREGRVVQVLADEPAKAPAKTGDRGGKSGKKKEGK
ncbi:MAG: MdtA/MuxA family multidrug efflux RND transporter periplasmic adaptor subunit [Opitutaceae bacterium]|nr:MdtA/MuxA family multidrug efflux RND transporter periplasmic adaptor subunit [Opitutaceae bacterium]